jgi:signal peptidase I
VLRVVLFSPRSVGSMEPNLSRATSSCQWTYGYSKHSIPFNPPIFNGRIMLPGVSHEPRRGDIVVFKLPRDNRRTTSNA